MADPITDILIGLAEQLHADLVGVWDPTGPVAADGVAITLRATPPSPDRVITLTEYLQTAQPGLTDSLVTINFMIRGTSDPNEAARLEHLVYLSLQGRRGALPNGALINQMWLQSATRVGPDANRRHVRSANYYAQFNRSHAGAQ